MTTAPRGPANEALDYAGVIVGLGFSLENVGFENNAGSAEATDYKRRSPP